MIPELNICIGVSIDASSVFVLFVCLFIYLFIYYYYYFFFFFFFLGGGWVEWWILAGCKFNKYDASRYRSIIARIFFFFGGGIYSCKSKVKISQQVRAYMSANFTLMSCDIQHHSICMTSGRNHFSNKGETEGLSCGGILLEYNFSSPPALPFSLAGQGRDDIWYCIPSLPNYGRDDPPPPIFAHVHDHSPSYLSILGKASHGNCQN